MSINLPKRRLVSQEDASQIQRADVPRSKFTGSWGRLATYDPGIIYPFVLDEIMPGDHMKYRATAMLRIQTLLFPMFSNQRVDTHWFFVPSRIVWPIGGNGSPGSWQEFMGQQSTPTAPLPTTVPQVDLINAGSMLALADHFGVPIRNIDAGAVEFLINSLPFRCYNLIWNEYYRDQNLQDSLNWLGNPGTNLDSSADYALRYRAKSHDYFTSSLPWAQKFTAPTVPLGGQAWVKGLGYRDDARDSYTGPITVRESDNSAEAYAFYREVGGSDEADPRDVMYAESTAASASRPMIYADLTSATGVTINALRTAMQVQALLERDARGGTRYTELVYSHFDVRSPDARLQRPEYIGGGSSPLMITPIAQTAEGTETTVGALGGAGTATGEHTASFAATEHGYVLGLISIKTELAYQQGLPKLFSRFTRFDFPWPAFAGLGEQAVLRKEIFATGIPGENDDDRVFGYQERYHEYRTRWSEVVGMFNSGNATPIDQWHLAQYFDSEPFLGEDFIIDLPPIERVLAAGVTATDMTYLADILITREAVRPLPVYGTPISLGRF